MLRNLAEAIWRRAPRVLRRLSMRLTNARFTVTAAGIIFDPEGRVLLLKHRFRAGSGWGIPGGFLNAGEQPEAGLRRELLEEVRLELKACELFKVRTFTKPRQLEIIFRCHTTDVPGEQSGEIANAGWFTATSLPNGLPDDQRQLIKQLLNDGAKRKD